MYLRLMIVVSALLLPQAATAGGIESLNRFYRQVDTLECDFYQVQLDDSGAVLQKAAGRFALARPDKFRWAYQEPYEQYIISDGERIWFHDVDLEQVTVRPVDQTLQGAPALLLSGGPELTQEFEIGEEGRTDGMDWLRLTPKSEGGDFAEVRMGLAGGKPRVMELHDALGQTTRIEFSEIRSNVPLDSSLFTFTPPEGVEVVGLEPTPSDARP